MKDQSSKIIQLAVNPETVLDAVDNLSGADQVSPVQNQHARMDSPADVGKANSPTEIHLEYSEGSPSSKSEEICLEGSDAAPKESESLFGNSETPERQENASLTVGNKPFSPFNGRYWIGEQIGTGGMGLVHLGWDLHLQRHVAIKLIRQDRKDGKQSLHRFLREARIASRLRHPGILGIHDFSVESSGSGYIIMDLITGKTMEQAICEAVDDEAKKQSLLTTFLQICQAVSFAHANGVVHRDLKPANIMVGDFGLATVLDWGLAKVVGSNWSPSEKLEDETEGAESHPIVIERMSRSPESFSTLFGTVMGTPYYLAPEQARGEVVDYRADVFSLGGILCHLLTGSPPFAGEKILDVYQKSASGDVSMALERLDRCGAPISIVNLAKHCLEPNVQNRPENASSLVRVLKAYFESGQRRAEEELVRFFDLSLDLFCIANTQGYFWKVNGDFSRTLGYTTKELTSSPFIEFVHPEDRTDTLNEIMRLSRGEPTIQFKNRYRKKNGEYIWLEWNARSLKEEGMIYAVARDITERILLEEEKELIESEYFRLSEIVQSATDAIIAKDLNGVVQSWNHGAEKLFGYSSSEMMGKPIHAIIPDERMNEEDAIIARIRKGEKVEHFETVRIHKSGQRIDISICISPIHDPTGTVIGASKIARSLSNQRLLESQLAKSRQALVEFAENANIPLHSVDQTGTILWANNAELSFLGYSRQEYIGQPIAKFHADQECISNLIGMLRQGEVIYHCLAKLIAKDGTIKDVAIYSSALQEDEDKFHTRCFTIDLSHGSTQNMT
jgi:serine/threonine-protein kinase